MFGISPSTTTTSTGSTLLQVAGSIPRWRTVVDFEPSSMSDLGKNRYWAQRLSVSLEANARFAQVEPTLQSDVRKIVSQVRSCRQILWACRLCMIGPKSGAVVTAEPTILITCGSQKCKDKIKKSLRRIRPHYLESIGMALIVNYDKDAPVLAGQKDLTSHNHSDGGDCSPGVIRIQRNHALTSCGLQIMIEGCPSEMTRKSYATLGGIIKLGEIWYGLTAAHSFINKPNILPDEAQSDDDLQSSSDFEDSSDENDSSAGEEEEKRRTEHAKPPKAFGYDTQVQRLPSRANVNTANSSREFIRLASVWPGSFMAYSFNGRSQTHGKTALDGNQISDWAILEIPEAYIKPNSYLNPTKTGDAPQRVDLKTVAASHQMEPGLVLVLCNAEMPHVGYLSKNHTSLQLTQGSLDVFEIFLQEPIVRGMSGTWVVRDDRLFGMVAALSNNGLSCFIIPMWMVFENIKAVCNQEISFTSPGTSCASQTSNDIATSAHKQQPIQAQSIGSKKPPITSTSMLNENFEALENPYFDLLSRVIDSQERIAKALSTIAKPDPILRRFLDLDERSETFSTPYYTSSGTKKRSEIPRSMDSISQGPTLVSTKIDVARQDKNTASVEVTLQAQDLDVQDLLKHMQLSDWESRAPKVLTDLFNSRALSPSDNTSLSLLQDIKVPGALLECYNVSNEGVATRLISTDSTPKHTSLSRLLIALDSGSSYGDFGKIIASAQPTVLQLVVLHMILIKDFDMSAILQMIVDDTPSKAYMKGYLEPQIVKQRSFVFSFKYHCIIGEGCEPLPWQSHDRSSANSERGFHLSTCSALIGLSLSGSSRQSTRQKSHRDQASKVHVFDPFGPWKLLKIQCFPDSISTLDDYETDSRFMNGPEAFLAAVLSEYQDAATRYRDIQQRISALIFPPTLVLDSELRDKVLFENSKYTRSRKYFWALQVLKTIDKGIEDMMASYAQGLTDAVWKGEHKYIWPGEAEIDHVYHSWRHKMAAIRKQFDSEIMHLDSLRHSNVRLQNDIDNLRAQLFTGLALEDSKEALKSTRSIRTLTTLSHILLPISLIFLLFSMNILRTYDISWSLLTDGTVATSAVVLIATLAAYSSLEIQLRSWWLGTAARRRLISLWEGSGQATTMMSTSNRPRPTRDNKTTINESLPSGLRTPTQSSKQSRVLLLSVAFLFIITSIDLGVSRSATSLVFETIDKSTAVRLVGGFVGLVYILLLA
ncbi:hypothetical protein F5Y16DRAFT_362409 [Xylariaceae sp. FL0255]|nr:hypothetical protein F5Y16DRAFT_362409 [Xylariaceae sp. FL0255]